MRAKDERVVGSAWPCRNAATRRGRDDATTHDNGLAAATAPALRRKACAPLRPNRYWLPTAGVYGAQHPVQGGGAGPIRGAGRAVSPGQWVTTDCG